MEKSNISIFLFFLFILLAPNIISELIDDSLVIKNKAWEGYEKNVGAYYIAYSPISRRFKRASGIIQLPASLNTNDGKRNAYISFGIRGFKDYFVDMGIMNSGDGWKPYYSKNGSLTSFPEYSAIEGVKYVEIEVELFLGSSLSGIGFYLHFMNDNLIYLKYFSVVIIPRDIVNNKIGGNELRFYRFASLVNIDGVPDDQNDLTYMINGGFTKLTIVVNGSKRSWGISGDYIETSWLVSSSKIEFSHADDHESFSIKHYEH